MSYIKDVGIEPKTKAKIKALVEAYITMFPEEFDLFKTWLANHKNTLEDMDFASVTGDHVMQRKLLELPEVLYNMLKNQLSEDEFIEFKGLKGSRWFAKELKAFTVPKYV